MHVSALDFMDSTGLHSLVRAATAMGDRGCLVIHGLDGKGSDPEVDRAQPDRAAPQHPRDPV